MITNEQANAAIKIMQDIERHNVQACLDEFKKPGQHAIPPEKALRQVLEPHEQGKWVKFDIPCDICEKELDYHPKHFSSSTNPHVHVCDACISELNYERFFIDSTPPTQEPLSEEQINALRVEVSKEYAVSRWLIHLIIRLTEQAHGIGVK